MVRWLGSTLDHSCKNLKPRARVCPCVVREMCLPALRALHSLSVCILSHRKRWCLLQDSVPFAPAAHGAFSKAFALADFACSQSLAYLCLIRIGMGLAVSAKTAQSVEGRASKILKHVVVQWLFSFAAYGGQYCVFMDKESFFVCLRSFAANVLIIGRALHPFLHCCVQEANGKEHFTSWHGVIGQATLFVGGLQLLTGFLLNAGFIKRLVAPIRGAVRLAHACTSQ